MSNLKSIISIEVQDEQYKNFIESYAEYNESLEENAKKWNDVAAAAGGAAHPMGGMSGDAKGIVSSLSAMIDQFTKINRESKKAENTTGGIKRNFLEALGFSREITSNMIRWGSIGTLGLGAAGAAYAGVSVIASSESNLRKQSSGYGMTAGQLEAAKVELDKYIDVESHLKAQNTFRNDAATKGARDTAGLSGMEGLSQSDYLLESLLRVRKTYMEHGGSRGGMGEQVAQAFKLHELGFSTEELKRLEGMTEAEIKMSQVRIRASEKDLDQTDKQLKSWQDLSIEMDKFGKALKIITANILLPVVQIFGGIEAPTSDQAKKNIGYSEEKKKDSSWFNSFFGAPALKGNQNSSIAPVAVKSPSFGDKLSKIAEVERKNGLPAGILFGQWGAESNFGKNKGYSKAGALGDWQFMKPTADQYGISDRSSFDQSLSGAGDYMSNLMRMFKNDVRKALAGYNWGEGKVQRAIRLYKGDWERHIPAETERYINKSLATANTITINNQTGGNATVSLSTVAH